MKKHILAAAVALLSTAAYAAPPNVVPPPFQQGGSSVDVNAQQIANIMSINKATSNSDSRATANSNSDSRATAYGGAGGNSYATGGTARAYGGNAHQGQEQSQSARTGDVTSVVGGQRTAVGGQSTSVVVEGDRPAAASAIAPTVIHGNSSECYWTFTIAGAAQGTSQGGSAGAGLFPVRLKTCMLFMLADRHASGYADNPEAARLLREIEASLR